MVLNRIQLYPACYGLVGLIIPFAYLSVAHLNLLDISSVIHYVVAVLWFTEFVLHLGGAWAMVSSILLNGLIYFLVGRVLVISERFRSLFFLLTCTLVSVWAYFLLTNSALEILISLTVWFLIHLLLNKFVGRESELGQY